MSKSERLNVYALVEREEKKTIWLRVGTAFVNKDDSINVYLDAVPLGGKLQIRRPSDNNKDADSEQ
ncbi:MAG: hypothetical protein WC683_10355 [bacterium]